MRSLAQKILERSEKPKNIDEDKNAMTVKSTFGMLQTAVQAMVNEKNKNLK